VREVDFAKMRGETKMLVN